MAGTVLQFEPGQWLSFTNDMVGPGGMRITLGDRTVYEGPAIKPGVIVTVWYRSVAERRPVADKVVTYPGNGPSKK